MGDLHHCRELPGRLKYEQLTRHSRSHSSGSDHLTARVGLLMNPRTKPVPKVDSSVAILAPVPYDLLLTGRTLCKERGRVAFMTKNAQLLAKAERLRGGGRLPALIFACRDPARAPRDYRVSWIGWYAGFAPCGTPAAATLSNVRPESVTIDPPGTCMWLASALVELEPIATHPISTILTFGDGKPRSGMPPHGLCVVPCPAWFWSLERLLS